QAERPVDRQKPAHKLDRKITHQSTKSTQKQKNIEPPIVPCGTITNKKSYPQPKNVHANPHSLHANPHS
uniref:hypothetical protein n=1 Tax=Thiolapillus sp. TaxID=2017437 RepID=UPI003AF56EC2